MQPLYMLTAVDVRRAEEAGDSRATTIVKITLPPIVFATASHNPGGGVGAVDFALPRIQAVEPAFEAKGIDTSIFGVLGARDRWVFAEAWKDKKTGADIGSRAIIEGVVQEWTPDDSAPDEFMGCNHAIKEVTHYEFTFNGVELWYFDFWERVIRRNGQPISAGQNRALGV